MRVRPGVSLTVSLLWSLVPGCTSNERGPSAIRTDSAGVEIVLSTGEDHLLIWTLQREFELGGKEEGPETFFSVGPMTVDVDGTGQIYVLDPQENHVAIFTPNGEFLRTVGGRGEGPGEISDAGSLSVSSDGSVSVFDYGRRGLVRFGPDGEILPAVPFRFFPSSAQNRHFTQTSDGFLVATMITPLEANTFRNALQLVSPTDTTVLADHSFPRPGMAMFPSCGGGLDLPRIFEVQVSWSARDGAVVVSRSDRYELELFRGGQITRMIRRELEPRTATEQMAIEELGEGFRINFGRGPCLIPPREMVDARGFAETLPWIKQITVAPGGELWVWRKEIGEDTAGPIDVFDATGEYEGTLPRGTPFPLVFIDDTRFGAAEKDEMDISRLVVYRIFR